MRQPLVRSGNQPPTTLAWWKIPFMLVVMVLVPLTLAALSLSAIAAGLFLILIEKITGRRFYRLYRFINPPADEDESPLLQAPPTPGQS
jgi:hypothetical protein